MAIKNYYQNVYLVGNTDIKMLSNNHLPLCRFPVFGFLNHYNYEL